jgi:hypothetical protein
MMLFVLVVLELSCGVIGVISANDNLANPDVLILTIIEIIATFSNRSGAV